MVKLTKTDFIAYRQCRKNIWVKLHQPEIFKSFEMSEFELSLLKVGNEVEELARNMFPGGYMVNKRSDGAEKLTTKLIAEKTPVIFQPVFSTDKYMAAADVFKWDPVANAYDIYEIKMSSSEEGDEDTKKDAAKELQYEYDLAFQAHIASLCHIPLAKKYLVRLNKKYVRMGELDYTPNQLFIVEDKTEAVDKLVPFLASEIVSAHIYLSDPKEPAGVCDCFYKGRSSHCTAFSYANREKNIPEYSVHDINRIGNSKAYLKELLDEGILDIGDVPIDERLEPKVNKKTGEVGKPIKRNQIEVHKSQRPIIELDSIKNELDALSFPLYFLDYETYPAAIPRYSGYRPYQNIVFQYSIHILTEEAAKKGLEPEHRECLIFDGDPAERVIDSLRNDIGPKGTIISWFKKFENSRNKEFGDRFPQHREFFADAVNRTYDLMDIVDKQYYVHPQFFGRSSIKKVFPALIKDDSLSYKTLGVKNGTDAIEAYRQVTGGEITGADLETKKKEMLEYCKLDTYAMYKLWRFFSDLVK